MRSARASESADDTDVPELIVSRGWCTRTMFARYSITDTTDLVEAQAKLNAAFATARPTIVPLKQAS